jgi:hypothetical protein
MSQGTFNLRDTICAPLRKHGQNRPVYREYPKMKPTPIDPGDKEGDVNE